MCIVEGYKFINVNWLLFPSLDMVYINMIIIIIIIIIIMWTNIEKHVKARGKGKDVITNAISANQHFTSSFSMQIFKFQRLSFKLFSIFPAPPPEHPGELACRLKGFSSPLAPLPVLG